MNERIIELIMVVVSAVLASNGFWAIFGKRINKNDATSKLVLGIAHDRLDTLCRQYLAKGEISNEELKNLIKYLYEPYHESGGNGYITEMVEKVKDLKINGGNNNEN